MKTKKLSKKLVLKKNTVVDLNPAEMVYVLGGIVPLSAQSRCPVGFTLCATACLTNCVGVNCY